MAAAPSGDSAAAGRAVRSPGLRAEARAFLDPRAGMVPAPVRSVLFGLERFHQHGISLAQAQPVERRRSRRRKNAPRFFPRLNDNLRTLKRMRSYLELLDREGDALSPAAEWLLDNFHLIEAQLPEIRTGLPRRYYADLPKLRQEPLIGLPRVYGIAWAFIAHTDSNFDPALLAHFLKAYQEVDELSLGELWALPTTLRVVLIENLSRLAETVASNKAAREAANWCCDQEDTLTQAQLDSLYAQLEQRGVHLAFLAQMTQRLRSPVPGQPSRWLPWLDAKVPDPVAALTAAQELQAANNVSVSHAVNALRGINNLDWKALVDDVSPVLQHLRRSAAFCADSEFTRDQCTHAIERLARRLNRSETKVAEAALQLSENAARAAAEAPEGEPARESLGPDYYLIGSGRAELVRALGGSPRAVEGPSLRLTLRMRWTLYAGAITIGTVALLAGLMSGEHGLLAPWAQVITVLLLAFPASECVIALVNRLVAESVRVHRLPRLGLHEGLQAEHRTLVVIPCFIGSAGTIQALAHRLEQHHFANPEAFTQYALLSDWADAPQRQAANDALLLDAARRAIDELNQRHPPPEDAEGEPLPPRFLLLHRERSWSNSEGLWMGWERKRGKLEQLLAWLVKAGPSPFMDLGAISRIAPDVRYLMTLDSDTEMPPGTLRELVAIAAHPLNRPQVEPRTRRVTRGYGILQPRIATPIPRPQEITPYGWMLSGQWGIDVYSSGSSEVYQDVFGEGSFSGKGLFDVRAVHEVLHERIPEGKVLSHDLYEGVWSRCAHLSDVVLLEAHPMHPDVAASRVHRWTRGDWQLLPFLRDALRGRVGALNLWKMIDNLRRSLLAPACVALLWWSYTGPGIHPAMATVLVLAALGLGPLMGALAGLAPSRDDIALRHFLREGGRELARALAGTAWQMAALLRHAMLQADAIARALWRMAVSRRGLLQWTTAAQAEAQMGREPMWFWRRHLPVSLAALAWTIAGAWMPEAESAWLLAMGALWLLTPLWLWAASRPVRDRRPAAHLTPNERDYLQHLARDTWRLFERAVTADDHHLPPDNLQIDPRPMLARRTSPTNIGLYLLSTVSAQRFGFIGLEEMLQRLGATLDSLDKLPRYRGHFYNWIDTQHLQTLNPPYVSTVDSGNLAGHLWAVAQACRELVSTPPSHDIAERSLRAAVERLQHANDIGLREVLKAEPIRTLLQTDLWPAWRRDPAALRQQWQAARQACSAALHNEDGERPELLPLTDLLRQLDSLLRDREVDRDRWPEMLRGLAQRFDAIANGMDFRFLYDPKRRLFHIGYRPGEAALDTSYYDLLASESRLTSYVAIAKGDVPRRHWVALGRPFIGVHDEPTLRSWSGSMFEYLMPSLVMDEPQGGLLQRIAGPAVQAQRDFGEEMRMPWGVSESAYFAQDHTLAFQYSPFGVPRLALRRTPPEDRVVAPYATVLAALVDPPAAVENLRRLERLGVRGIYGFIEAVDYTKTRLSDDGHPQPVSTFMAHHQGMSLVALCNLLCDTASSAEPSQAEAGPLGGRARYAAAGGQPSTPRGWFQRAPIAQSHQALLQERLPHEIVFQVGAVQRRPDKAPEPAALSAVRVIAPEALLRGTAPTQLLGNGAYSVALRPSGAGHSSWKGRSVTRWRDDALRDSHGTWLMLRRAGEVEFHSLTPAPNPRPDASYMTRFFNDHVEFDVDCEEWESRMVVWVSPDDDVEFRRVTLHNLGEHALEFELLSCFEAVLSPQRADESHPAFSNLFIQAHEVDPQCVMLERRPRLHTEQGMWAAHFLATCEGEPGAVRVLCDRARLLPRLGSMAHARPGASQQPDAHGVFDTGLDPIASLTVRIQVPAQARLCLTFATAAAADADALMSVIDKYRQDVHLKRARLMSATLARIRHRELRVETADIHAIQDMSTLMLLSRTRHRKVPEIALDRRALWRFGISGDKPIALLRINATQGLPVLRALLTAHRLWEIAGLACDLVIVNGEPASYLMPLQQHITAIRNSMGVDQHTQPDRGGVHVLRAQELAPTEIAALQAYARIDLLADGRPLAKLLAQARAADAPPPAPATAAAARPEGPMPLARRKRAAIAQAPWPDELASSHFSSDGREFEIVVTSQRVTPRPWANVLANPDFGCIVTESGAGFTWAANSRMNQLTVWSNDALLDPPSEHFLVQDRETREAWGLMPTQDRNGLQGYRVVHTQGMSSFSHERAGLAIDVRVAVHPRESVKCLRVRLRNTGNQPRQLRLLGMVEWVMGSQRQDRMTLSTEYVPEVQAVLARQLEHMGGFGDGTAFLMLAGLQVGQWTCDRSEFFDALGNLEVRRTLRGAHGVGLDPCGALDGTVDLAPGTQLDCFWALGYGVGRDAAIALARRMKAPGALAAITDQAVDDWNRRLSAIVVRTPDALFDAMVNRWLLYQAVVCRIWAKAGFYQAGGATGFRDQLQDAMALVYAEPRALREQILLHASRQFPEGDVQHWWHSPTGAGVRTHFSDDLLWLPYALQHYLEVTGDRALLEAEAPFLEGAAVPEGAEDAYYVPTVSGQTASVYEHAARTIDRGLRFGVHGLPLMGTGDWNDGMNRIGHHGRGESVWLGWFVLKILQDWIPLAQSRSDDARAQRWAQARDELEQAMRKHGWDGAWYRRAYFDNGHPLGSHLNDECKIDLIAQAWSVFASPPGDLHAAQAMQSADTRLVDRRVGVIRLLDPPLQYQADNAGYIQAYPPGVRENGGQYSHAAVWAAIAQAQLGHGDLAWEYFQMLSPAHRARGPAGQRRYRIEPYVMAGDTYSVAPYEGRGGWSWYTGSASWLYRAAIESMLGLVLRPDRFCFAPNLPSSWPEAELTLRLKGHVIYVVLRVQGRGALRGDEGLPPGTQRVPAGQWVMFSDLPSECTLLVEVPQPPDRLSEHGDAALAEV